MRAAIAAVEVAGLGLFVAGWWMLAPWLGAVVGGLVLVAAAVAVERSVDG